MIECKHYRELINKALDCELNDFEQVQLDEHLNSCDSCKKYYDDIFNVQNKLNILPNIRLEESIVDQLLEFDFFPTEEDRVKKNFFKDWRAWYGVAAAVIVILVLPLTIIGNQLFNENLGSDDGASMLKGESILYETRDVEKSDNCIPECELSEEYGIVGVQLTDEPNTNNEYVATDFAFKYEFKVIDNKLNIYLNEEKIYETKQWSDNLYVDWYQFSEEEIIYSLYNQDDYLVNSYKINLINKIEEIIE